MTFDIAITSYKRPALAKAAVQSCLRQGPLLRNVIVVDDGSGDDTATILRALGDSRLIVHVRPVNGGIAAARRDAFALSDADWTVSLDSDHELMEGALERLAALAELSSVPVDILGARYRWDTGGVSPKQVPDGPVGYRERIEGASRPEGIGSDYLCAVSRRLRAMVKWEPLRSIFPDTLFQLDLAKAGTGLFTQEVLALQKSCTEHSWTRGKAAGRWARRSQDAPDGIKCLGIIEARHGEALRRWGRPMLSDLFATGTLFAVITDQRRLAWRWAGAGLALRRSKLSLSAMALALMPRAMLARAYQWRG